MLTPVIASPRDINAQRQAVFDPRDDGATTGASASDNLTAIQTTITAAATVKGVVRFAELYEVSGQLDVPSNATLEGNGRGTGVKLADGANTAVVRIGGTSGARRSKITLRNLEIDGNKANQTPGTTNLHGVSGNWCDDATIEGCYVHDTLGNGIVVLGDNPQIHHNRVGNCGQGGGAQAGRAGIVVNRNSGLVSDSSPRPSVTHNHVWGYAEHGIKVYENAHSPDVSHNHVWGGAAGSGWGIYITGCRRPTVIANIVEDAIGLGIQVTDENTGADSYDVIVTGNIVSGGSNGGINVTALTATSVRAIVTGNIARDNDQDGIAVARFPYSIVADNIAYANGRHGISVYRSSRSHVHHNQSVNNGQITAGSYGFRIWDDNTTAQEYLTIDHNHAIDDQGSPTQDDGFRFQNLAANNYCDHNVAAGNVANWTGVPASNTMRNNVGYVTKAKGDGSILNGATTATITHGLARTPTRKDVTITLGEDPANSPGAIWVDTLGASTFRVNCENDPGASGLDFSWRGEVE